MDRRSLGNADVIVQRALVHKKHLRVHALGVAHDDRLVRHHADVGVAGCDDLGSGRRVGRVADFDAQLVVGKEAGFVGDVERQSRQRRHLGTDLQDNALRLGVRGSAREQHSCAGDPRGSTSCKHALLPSLY